MASEWRTESMNAARKLGLTEHELKLLEHLLDDIDQLKRAIRDKSADEFMMAAASLNFHHGELYQRGVSAPIHDAQTLLSHVDASVHFWDILAELVENLQEGVKDLHRVEMPPMAGYEVCQDMLKRLEETKQIYIVGLDIPISVTKGLFSLLDAKRRGVARQKGVPEEQFDFEDMMGYFLGIVDPSGEKPATSKCWVCGLVFVDDRAEFCESCQTFKCPGCGAHFCSLPEEVKRALDAEMFSVGLWSPYENPPKRKKRRKAKPIEVIAREDERTRDILRRAGYGV